MTSLGYPTTDLVSDEIPVVSHFSFHLEQAKKALDANQKQLATATPETVPMWFRQPSKKLKVPVRWKGCLPGS